MRPAACFLTLDARRHFLTAFVDGLHLDPGIRDARETAVPLNAFLAGNAQVGTAFGGAVQLAEQKPMAVRHLYEASRHGCPSA